MYGRDVKFNRLLVKRAWYTLNLPNCIIVELPDGVLKFFAVLANGIGPQDGDLRDYLGYHPEELEEKSTKRLSEMELFTFGLAGH